MEPTWRSPNGPTIESNGDKIGARTEVEIHLESMGNSYGVRLELVGKSDGLFGNVLGMHRGCWGMSVKFIGNYYQLFGKQLVFIGNPWDISGDFWLRIHSLGEVQIQTEHIHTHAISLTKQRFPFHVLTGLIFHFFCSRLSSFFV